MSNNYLKCHKYQVDITYIAIYSFSMFYKNK